MTEADLPGAWRNADDESKRGQRQTLWLTGLKIGGGLSAAIGGALSWHFGSFDIAAWIILFGFISAFGCELALLILQPERTWYEGRAVAESVKTLAWRYSVCADPFSKEMSRAEAESNFRQRISSILSQVSDNVIFDDLDPVITDCMDALRSLEFSSRRSEYVKGRTLEQKQWYASKVRTNRRKARLSSALLAISEFLAATLAAGRAFGGWSVDLAGLLAAMITAGTAWVAVKQFSPLASAYAVATKELGIQASRLLTVDEEDWPLLAADAEEAISREHTTWLASRIGHFPNWNDTQDTCSREV
ncbi:DUF4231 domain-containing protein [Actinomyces sp. oral taxon 448]|uniref:DUF4231 domain-containing protein n=1 Tax=Actinomyces sp. oral taxon 448 TaxID=712124 RepID=UPI0025BE2DC9|nr:DUF4231 domain-containing protein [Actinomyces sp. oral taxon 448]